MLTHDTPDCDSPCLPVLCRSVVCYGREPCCWPTTSSSQEPRSSWPTCVGTAVSSAPTLHHSWSTQMWWTAWRRLSTRARTAQRGLDHPLVGLFPRPVRGCVGGIFPSSPMGTAYLRPVAAAHCPLSVLYTLLPSLNTTTSQAASLQIGSATSNQSGGAWDHSTHQIAPPRSLTRGPASGIYMQWRCKEGGWKLGCTALSRRFAQCLTSSQYC